jgi:hypothetical protein
METASEIILGVVTPEWNKVTPIAHRIKNKNAFRGEYSKVVAHMFAAARDGLVEIKHERTGKAGPQTRFIRKKVRA